MVLYSTFQKLFWSLLFMQAWVKTHGMSLGYQAPPPLAGCTEDALTQSATGMGASFYRNVAQMLNFKHQCQDMTHRKVALSMPYTSATLGSSITCSAVPHLRKSRLQNL